ncbi:MAG: signal peptidase I [Pyrinomonadaceae bacterium]
MHRLLILVILVTGLFSGCDAQTYRVVTPNMSPTLKVGDVRRGVKLDDKTELRRFDIIVFKLPEEVRKVSGDKPGALIISRVIGLPGEKIEVRAGQVYVNDEPLAEPFEMIVDKEKSSDATIVPENEYYVLGDNRPESLDSRHWKQRTITRSEISARIEEIK